jgi:transcriptional regulator with XRE-family HTH domain
MESSRFGRGVRAIRIRAGRTQEDVARRSGVRRAAIAAIERGALGGVRVEQIVAVALELAADVDIVLRWNGTELDRLVNAGHSAMHELVARVLTETGWEIVPECSFSIWGERGVIDVVAWHAATRTLLIVELKTEIADVQRLIGTVDRYRRLAPEIAKDRGWDPLAIGVWVAVADSRTNRRRLAAHTTVLRAAFPTDGRTVAGWLRSPSGGLRALSFLTDVRVTNRTAARSSRRRVRPASGRVGTPDRPVRPGQA